MLDTKKIADTILGIEDEIYGKWSNGDCTGYLNAYRDDVTYIDPFAPQVLVGKAAVKAYFDQFFQGQKVERGERIAPQVVVTDDGNTAIVTYNLQEYKKDEQGEWQPLPRWHYAAVYRFENGKWGIAHNNWSFSQHPAILAALGM